MMTSCGSSGTRSTSWQSKAMPTRRGVQALAGQPGDGAVVVAGAIADAVAARVEGGERHQHQRRIEHGVFLGPGRPCRNPCRPAARRAPVRERRWSCLSRMAGRQSRAPLLAQAEHQRPHVDFRAHRPEAGDNGGSVDRYAVACQPRPCRARPRCARTASSASRRASACSRSSRFSSLADVMQRQ